MIERISTFGPARVYRIPAGRLYVPTDRARKPWISFCWAPLGAVTKTVERSEAARGLRSIRHRQEA